MMPTKTNVTILREAASYIKKHGHAHGVLVNFDGKVCLAGALNVIQSGDPCRWTKRTSFLIGHVGDYLGRDQPHPIDWNGDIALDVPRGYAPGCGGRL